MSDANSPADREGAQIVLIMSALALSVVGFNTTAVATILPNLKSQFDLTPSQLQWVMASYTVASATLVTILSRLGDIIGKMEIFMLGMVVFACGSALALFSQDATMLLAGRGAQGAGASALFGTSLAILTAATPEVRRASVVGLWSAIAGLAIGVGPILGGSLGEYISWRVIFAVDLILLGIAFTLAVRVRQRKYVPDTRMSGAKFDGLSAIAIACLLGPLSFGLSNSESRGWTDTLTLVPFGIALVAAVALFFAARRSADPLVEFRYFKHPRFLMATTGMFFTGFTLFCFFVYFNVFVQSPDAFDYNAVQAGLAVLPLSLSMFAVSVVAPRFLAPYSFRWPLTLGMAALLIGFSLLTTTQSTTDYADLWWKLVLVGIGMGFCFSLLPRLGLRLLPDEHAGQGAGVINTFLYFGATLGAVTGGIASSMTTRLGLKEVIATLPQHSSEQQSLSHALVHGTPSQIQQLIAGLNPADSATLAGALRDLQDNAFDSTMVIAAGGALVALVLAVVLLRGPVPPLRDAVKFTNFKGAPDS